jgi:hypothetical protein
MNGNERLHKRDASRFMDKASIFGRPLIENDSHHKRSSYVTNCSHIVCAGDPLAYERDPAFLYRLMCIQSNLTARI